MARIPNHQVPESAGLETKEFLGRLVSDLNIAFSDSALQDSYKILPKLPTERKIYFFEREVLPEITQKGYWHYDKPTDTWNQCCAGGGSGDHNIDGGSPDDVYLPSQNVDGGGP